jgi:hypothetical protein
MHKILTLSVKSKMKRLSLEELKAQKGNVVTRLEAIKGGNADDCHYPDGQGGCGGNSNPGPGGPVNVPIAK